MFDTGGNGANFGRFEPLDDFFGPQPGCKVEVADGQVQEIVAYRAADIARQALVGSKGLEQASHASLATPPVGIDPQLHCSLRERLMIIAAVAPQILRSFHTIS